MMQTGVRGEIQRPGPRPMTSAPIERLQIRRSCCLTRSDAELDPPELVVDVRALADADLRAVDAVARIVLVASRQERPVRVVGASPALRELFAICGLTRVLNGPAGARRPRAISRG